MKKRVAFTLIELLVVVAIIGILIGLISPGIRKAKENAKKTQAQVEMKSIETAIKAFFNEYGKLPVPGAEQGVDDYNDDLDADNSRHIILALTAMEEGSVTSAGGMVNPRKIAFLEPQSTTGADTGRFVDPWGEQYRIALDTDYNGILDIDIGGDPVQQIRRKQAIVSLGLYMNGGESDSADILKSWQ